MAPCSANIASAQRGAEISEGAAKPENTDNQMRDAAADANGNGKAATAHLIAVAIPAAAGLLSDSSNMNAAASLAFAGVVPTEERPD